VVAEIKSAEIESAEIKSAEIKSNCSIAKKRVSGENQPMKILGINLKTGAIAGLKTAHLPKITTATTLLRVKKMLVRVLPAVALWCSACAPEIGLTVPVPSLPDPTPTVGGPRISEGEVKVRVGSFKDTRASQTFVVVDGRKVGTQGSTASAVEEAFARYLREAGARIAVLNTPSIDGEILDWNAQVQPAFPASEAKASARLKVTVRDSRAHPLYHATFTGEASTSHPMVDSEMVQKLLGEAMGSAIQAAVRDDEFVAQLAKGRIE
jgi:hypothetical protein